MNEIPDEVLNEIGRAWLAFPSVKDVGKGERSRHSYMREIMARHKIGRLASVLPCLRQLQRLAANLTARSTAEDCQNMSQTILQVVRQAIGLVNGDDADDDAGDQPAAGGPSRPADEWCTRVWELLNDHQRRLDELEAKVVGRPQPSADDDPRARALQEAIRRSAPRCRKCGDPGATFGARGICSKCILWPPAPKCGTCRDTKVVANPVAGGKDRLCTCIRVGDELGQEATELLPIDSIISRPPYYEKRAKKADDRLWVDPDRPGEVLGNQVWPGLTYTVLYLPEGWQPPLFETNPVESEKGGGVSA